MAYVVVVQKQNIGNIDRNAKKPLGDAIVVPYWLARSVQDKNIANLRYSSLTCTLLVVAGGEEAPHRVSLPVMQNIKAVKGGDELAVFDEPCVPSSIMPAQKLDQPSRKRPAAAM